MTQFISTLVEGRTGIIELDRPKALNSLNPEMIAGIREAVDAWLDDAAIEQVLIRSSSERAFCAGGDVRSVAEEDAAGLHQSGDEFFTAEYGLNRRLATYPKPIVAIWQGVVMGGGFGISAHGSHRVVGPKVIAAMPEAAIAFVPDVGMTHRLNNLTPPEGYAEKLPEAGALAVFLGTTGWRMNSADLLATGLATHYAPDPQAFGDAVGAKGLARALREDAQEPATALADGALAEPSNLVANAQLISEIFGGETWLDIERALAAASAPNEAGQRFLDDVRAAVKKANPTSLVAITEIMRHARHTDLATALRNEFAVGAALRRDPNFPEGIRAVLVDKDQSPQFEPSDASAVDPSVWREMLES
ncbi:MAG TPA: enoyl-CoA hydratase/isomerase family protein [Candidatus Corynebacterium intestinavium]|uniref:3-hydroxyisobutyryl-CoA hydrolase n=1 Tax=Candidatus Corynebacterium intestinavium TaxID=2838531 RepID=A0A9D2UBD5_9CORY|nr:enoyl-CoA hydratase/isomerase family protein [Candidatus Corynebacterium intestinavium]